MVPVQSEVTPPGREQAGLFMRDARDNGPLWTQLP